MLKIAENLSLPLDAVTQTFGIFGRKGSGKTYAAGKLAETMLDAKAQVVILDPVGNWYGLRLDPSGKRASRFTLPILGGEHGDVPLEPQAGAIIAGFVVNTGSSAVIDVSRFRKGERKDFVTAFAEELFHKKKSARTPMHFVIEEAQVFAPQKTFRGEERMLGALEDIVRLGRNYGIGSTMISQRPQSVNTELRNQCEPLVVLQLVAKHERDAIGDWMEHMGVDSDLEELSKLQPGECFFWSPAWLNRFVKTRFLEKESFDASATPKLGATAREPKKLDPVDLQALEAAMKQTIERAKAQDPRALQDRVRELERQLQQRPTAEPDEGAIAKAVDIALREQRAREEFEVQQLIKRISIQFDQIKAAMQQASAVIEREFQDLTQRAVEAARLPEITFNHPAPSSNGKRASTSHEHEHDLDGVQLRALRAVIALYNRNLPINRVSVARWMGIHPNGGRYNVALRRLKDVGFINSDFQPTEDTPAIAPLCGRGPEGVLELLDQGKRRVLEIILEHEHQGLTREELAAKMGVHPNGGRFNSNLRWLRDMGVVTDRGPLRAVEGLFR